MKSIITKLLMLAAVLSASANIYAYDFKVDGIYYNIISSSEKTVAVTESSYAYSGDIIIPEQVTYNNVTYSITSIGDEAFYYCRSLASVTIPNSVTSIGDEAFYSCSGLASITIPNSVTSIGDKAFYGCYGLESVNISDLSAWCRIDFSNYLSNPLFYGNLYLNGGLITDLAIPDGITEIKAYAFYDCSGLTSVTIGNSVTSIGDYAFHGCSGLTSVTIPNSVTSIGDYAFYGCSGLVKAIWLPNTPPYGYHELYDRADINYVVNDSYSYSNRRIYPLINSLKEINGIKYVPVEQSESIYDVIDYVGNETSINIGEGLNVANIAPYAFNGCNSLASVAIPGSVTSIGDYAFRGCSGLTSVTIPNSVTSIGDSAFSGCSGLKELTFEDSAEALDIRNEAFAGCSIETLYLGRDIPNLSYIDKSKLSNLTIGGSVTSIGDYAFRGCSGLKELTFEDSAEALDIRNEAFAGCSIETLYLGREINANGSAPFDNATITDLTIGKNITTIGNSIFANCSGITSVSIPGSVTSIGSQAFYNCSGLKELTFEDSAEALDIRNEAFAGCSIETLYLGRDIPNLSYIDKSKLSNLTIGGGVTTIGDSAFNGCNSLASVAIPGSVTSIGDSAFSDCSSLDDLIIEDGKEILNFGTLPFENSPLKTVYLGRNLKFPTYSGNSPFYSTQITNLTISDAVTSIETNSFSGCNSLKSVTIPESVTTIGDSAFSGCSSLASVTIPNSIISIGNSAFQGCNTLSSLTIGGNVNSIGDFAFSGCSSLASVTIPNSVTSIGDYVFENCDNLYSLIIGSGVSQIGEDAANPIKTIWMPNTPPNGYRNANGKVNYVANDLFTALSNVTVYPFISSLFEVDGVRYVPVVPSERTCDAIDCTYNPDISDFDLGKINYLGITMLVQNIQPYTFYRNAKIQNIIIPWNATFVGDYNFDGCTSLKYVTINDRETELELGSNGTEPLFVSCPLDTVYIGGNISYPTSSGQGYSPFYQNETLEKITIANVENSITEKEFYNCINLKDVSIGDDVEIIGDWAFSGCVVLNNFSFGSSMKEIGEEAFSDCIAMTNITSKATVPPVCGWQALDDINKWNCTLTVPLSAVDSYKAAEQWKEFFFITGEDFDNTSGVDNVLENGGVSVTTNRDCIEIIGVDNAVITVYNTNGQIVYSGTETTVGGLAQGIYIVSVDGQTFKVAL